MRELKKGDVVRLKSGGPKMTVGMTGGATAEGSIECVWYDVVGKLNRDWFHAETLDVGEIQIPGKDVA
jgi:uncharacterized protein YodC (DUF2158 family)